MRGQRAQGRGLSVSPGWCLRFVEDCGLCCAGEREEEKGDPAKEADGGGR